MTLALVFLTPELFFYMKIGPEMSELCSSQICGSNMETDVTMTKYGNCDTEYLEPQI